MKMLALSAVLLGVIAGTASATTAYMKPAVFYTPEAQVTIDAAFTSQFFTPGISLDSPDFKVVLPDGQTSTFANMAVTAQDSSLTASLPDAGTYRVTTGELVGQVRHLVADNGRWRPLADGETPPAGAQTTTLQTVSVAEAYVTRGAPSRGAVDTNIGTLAIHPVTHPNQILVSTVFEVQLLLNGQPFPNMPFVLYESGDPDANTAHTFITGADGHATIAFDHPGTYILAIRYIGDAPPASGAEKRSYTTTLTFEVMNALPAIQAIVNSPAQQQQHRPNRHTTRELFHEVC